MSFLSSDVLQVDEEIASTRSSGYLTALPRWESIKNTHRPRLQLPIPIIPKRAHVRKESQSHILEKEALAKEAGVYRSDSQRSKSKFGAFGRTDVERPRQFRMLICLVAILVAVLILAIVLGAVLGTIVNSRQSGPQPSITEFPAGITPIPGIDVGSQPPVKTPHVASVSAAGWSVPGPAGYVSLWLFWQNSQGYLSRAAFNSSNGNWTRVSNFAKAKKGTPLAVTALDSHWYAGNEVLTLFTELRLY